MQTLSLRKTYKKYPEYKSSGIEWIGKIPNEWKTSRAKNLFRKMNRTPLVSDEIITAFRDGTVTLRSNRREDGFTMADKEIGYQRIEKRDLVIHGMDAFAGAIGVSDSDGKASPVYSVCTPIKSSDAKYYSYLLRHMSKSNFIFALAKGIRERSTEFRFKEFGNLWISEPSFEEQITIGNFLDKKTAFIDQIIEKKKKLIELLKEKRTAVINQAMKNRSKYKDEEWRSEKIKHLVKSIESGVWGENPQENLNDIKCLRVADFDYENLSFSNVETIRNNSGLSKKKILQNGDILMEKSGGGEKTPVGRAILFKSNEKMVCANFIDIVRVNREKVLPDFLVLYLSVLYSQRLNTKYIKQNTGIQNIDIKDYFGEIISFPEIEVQKGIVDHVYGQMKRFDDLILKVQKSIETLQEFKPSLISNVVTGKVRV